MVIQKKTISDNDCLIGDPQFVAEIPNDYILSIYPGMNLIHKELTGIIRYFQVQSSITKIENFVIND